MVKRSASGGNRVLAYLWSLVVLGTAAFLYKVGLPPIYVGLMALVGVYIALPHKKVFKCKKCSSTLPTPAGLEGTIRSLVLIFSFLWIPGALLAHFKEIVDVVAEREERRQAAESGREKLDIFSKENENRVTPDPIPPPKAKTQPLPVRPARVSPTTAQPPAQLTKVTQWTDQRGRKLQAALISVTEGVGLFRRPAGETFKLPIKQLSDDDVELIDIILEQKGLK